MHMLQRTVLTGHSRATHPVTYRWQACLLHLGSEPETGDPEQLEAVERAAEAGQGAVQQGHRQLQGAVVQTQVVLSTETASNCYML